MSGTLTLTADVGFRSCAWMLPFQRLGDSRNMFGRIAAAAAGNIDQPAACKVAQITCHVPGTRSKPVCERDWQTGIGIAGNRGTRFFRKVLEERIHQIGAE